MTSLCLFYDFFRLFLVRSIVKRANDMVLVMEAKLAPAPAPASHLSIDVIYTTVEATLVALRRAAWLASKLSARIMLHVLQVVPYPLPLESPPVLLDWNARRFRVISEENRVDTKVNLYL